MDIPYEFAIQIRKLYYTHKITETIGTYINNMNDKLNNLKD